MWRSRATLAALALVGLAVLGVEACTQGDPCLRHSDCPDEQKCAQGACVFGSRDGEEDTGTPADGASDGDEAGETTDVAPDGGLDTLDASALDASDTADSAALDASDTADSATLDASDTDGSAADSASLDASETAPDASTDATTTDIDAGG